MRKLSLVSVIFLAACSADMGLSLEQRPIETPKTWQDEKSQEAVEDNWLQSFDRTDLNQFVTQALENNLELKQLYYDMRIKEEELSQAGASFFPTLDGTLSQQRTGTTETSDGTNSASIGLSLGYEPDIWGKYSAQQKKAASSYLYAKATYEQARQQLVGDVVTAWVNVLEAIHLLDLYEQRVLNGMDNRDIIESGYEKGLNEALDVYLVRNELDSEITSVTAQKNTISSTKRALERYLGVYPSGLTEVLGDLPLLTQPIKAGLPADLIERKPSLTASWHNLLSYDAALAFAHKERLPALNLTATIEDTAEYATNLFGGDPMPWSLIGKLTAPIFDAGKLKSAEEVARLQLRQAEFQYLSDIYDAYELVENAITNEKSLESQYETTLQAAESAKVAADLSFEQYQRGLVEYTTVLESQNRYYDAQVSLIQIKADLVSNRVALHVALGGDFAQEEVTEKDAQ